MRSPRRLPLPAALGLAFGALLGCGGEEPAPAPGGPLGGGPAASLVDPGGADLGPRARLEIPPGAPTVVFLGDSISAGLHLGSDAAFPALVQRSLAAAGLPFELINAGVSGDTSAGGVRRLDWLLAREPAVVVVELGGNDGLRGLDPAQVEANLRLIVAGVREAGARVLLLGMRLPPSLGADYVERFEGLYPRLAEELELAFVPYFMEGVGGVPEFNLSDGLHPNFEGHRRIARRVARSLGPLLAALED